MSEEKKEKIKVDKGFTVGIDGDGKIHIDPFGISSDLELLGIMNFVDIKRNELLQYIAGTPEVKSLAIAQATGQGLATLLNAVSGEPKLKEAKVPVTK
jgi:hypothetical protein